jgi:hypothetical protein
MNNIDKYCIKIKYRFNIFKKGFSLTDVFTENIESLFIKTANSEGLKILKYFKYRKHLDETTCYNDTYIQVLIFDIRFKDIDKLDKVIQKLHDTANLMGYTDFEECSINFKNDFDKSKNKSK